MEIEALIFQIKMKNLYGVKYRELVTTVDEIYFSMDDVERIVCRTC